MKLVIIESPYAGNTELNLRYARACLADSLSRGEAPFASHLLYTQPGVLDDTITEERLRGIQAGLEWGIHADMTAAYINLGISAGMDVGINAATMRNLPIVYRHLPPEVMAKVTGETSANLTQREIEVGDVFVSKRESAPGEREKIVIACVEDGRCWFTRPDSDNHLATAWMRPPQILRKYNRVEG